MKRRYRFLLLLALWASFPGCAVTSRRDDGTPIFGPRAWNESPAPPQRAVMLTANRSDAPADPGAPRREGLAKYFPGLGRTQPTEAPRVAAASPAPRYRPTWFGLRPIKATGTQTYMTDSREQLNRPGASPTALPVALQVPTDRMVRTTNAEPPVAEPAPSADPGQGLVATSSSSDVPDLGGKPSKPGEDEVNPLPPASEPSAKPVVVDRMPQVPPVDPLEGESSVRPAPKPVVYDDAAPDINAVKVSIEPTEPSEPAAADEPNKPAQPQSTRQVAETSKVAVPTSVVYASPQGEPLQAKPHVHATAKVKPTPQAGETSKTWKRPCLRRLVRKVGKLGEYANPPTAAPH